LRKDNNIFYSLQYFADQCGVSAKVLLAVLGSVVISVDKNSESGKKLSNKIDVGLNLVNINSNMIVPEMIRIDLAKQDATGKEKLT
jgi:hypothetical protein